MQSDFGQLPGSTINKMCDLRRCQSPHLPMRVARHFIIRTIDLSALSE
jgi:hypothetical protein